MLIFVFFKIYKLKIIIKSYIEFLIIFKNSSDFKLAPPTKTPSTLLIFKISEEFWEIYMLRKERITKTQSTANFILWGGAVICPILLGLIVSVFGSGKAGSFELNVDLSLLNLSFFFYMMVLGAGGVWMQSVILQTTKTAIWRMPMYMFIATTTLLLALRISIV